MKERSKGRNQEEKEEKKKKIPIDSLTPISYYFLMFLPENQVETKVNPILP